MTAKSQDVEPAGAPAVHRRSVLKWLGIGVGSAVVAGGVGVGARGAANGAFYAGSGAPYALWSEWASLSGVDCVVAAGVLACNPHNTQPWRIGVGSGIDGDVIEVRSDPARRMPVNDAAHREHFAGLGCAIENMVVAAGPGSVLSVLHPPPCLPREVKNLQDAGRTRGAGCAMQPTGRDRRAMSLRHHRDRTIPAGDETRPRRASRRRRDVDGRAGPWAVHRRPDLTSRPRGISGPTDCRTWPAAASRTAANGDE